MNLIPNNGVSIKIFFQSYVNFTPILSIFFINIFKKVYYNENDLSHAKEVESLTIWSFAHLFENPFLSNEDLYFSKSRTLSARNGEWLTFDPMIKWNVEQLLNSPVDYNGFKYVNGDPVNFVDPSGKFALPIIIAGATIVGGASIVAGGAVVLTGATLVAAPIVAATYVIGSLVSVATSIGTLYIGAEMALSPKLTSVLSGATVGIIKKFGGGDSGSPDVTDPYSLLGSESLKFSYDYIEKMIKTADQKNSLQEENQNPTVSKNLWKEDPYDDKNE